MVLQWLWCHSGCSSYGATVAAVAMVLQWLWCHSGCSGYGAAVAMATVAMATVTIAMHLKCYSIKVFL